MKRIFAYKRLFICILLAFVTANNIAQAAAPTITSFFPLTGPVDTKVTIQGTGFSADPAKNVVLFGTLALSPTFVSTTELNVLVPAGAVYEKITVIVDGLSITSNQFFLVTSTYNCALTKYSFNPKVEFPTGFLPFAIASKDIDNDGKIDMVVCNNLSNDISIYKNVSGPNTIEAGSFATSTFSLGGVNPTAVLLEDLDGDSKPDLIVSYNSSNYLEIFPNTSSPGTITFGSKVSIPITYGFAKKITVADLDADGKPDLIATYASNKSLGLLRNTSTLSAISFDPVYDLSTFENPQSVIAGDLNGDNMPEIITTNSTSTNIKIFQNKGSSGGFNSMSFDGSNSLSTPGGSTSVLRLADFNSDGLLDFVINSGNAASNTSIAFLKNVLPSGTKGTSAPLFAEAVIYRVPQPIADIAIADFNGDGRPDVAATLQYSDLINIYLNTTTSTGSFDASSFATPAAISASTWPGPLTVADFDNDGNADLAAILAGTGAVGILKRVTQQSPSGSMTFPGNNTTPINSCATQQVSMEVRLRGKSPWSIQYQLNGSTVYETVTDIVDTDDDGDYTYILNVFPEERTTYKLSTVRDAQLCSDFTNYTTQPLVVNIISTPEIKPNTIPNADVGTPYNQALSLIPAMTPISWSVSSTFPTDLSFSNGSISGNPKIRNTYTFSVSAEFAVCPSIKQYSFLISDNSTTWNGTSWSNGKPESSKDAIINANYNTALNGSFSCFHLVVNEFDTLFIKSKNTIIVAGNAINNGTIYKDCSVTFTIAGSSVGPAPKIVQPQILPAFLASGLINMNYKQPLQISIGESPTYTLTNSLPGGLTLSNGIIAGIPNQIGRFDFSIHSTEYNGTCEASGNFSIFIQTADPNLKFPANGVTKVSESAPFSFACTTQSSGAITYSIEPANGCASIDATTGKVTILCGGPVKQYTITAIQEASFVFKGDTATSILSIEKIKPQLSFYKTGYVLGITTGNTIQYQVNSTGAVTIFQIDNNNTAIVDINGAVTPLAVGPFNVLVKVAETSTTAPFDTIVTMGVYSSFVPPVTVPILLNLEVGEDTVINILTHAQGITGALKAALTDIDTENTGKQFKFYSTPLGNFLIDSLGNLSVKPFRGFIGQTRLGYILTDENGTDSDIYYVMINIQPPYIVPPLKANEVMTPNNDGLNDSFVIAYMDDTKENSLTISDEAGNVIYTEQNYQNNWTGINNKGNVLEPGIYFYAFAENNNSRTLNGYIQILK